MPSSGQFIQHFLSDDQRQAGMLAPIDDVTIPDEPIAMTTRSADQLGADAGITFQESFDDLDSGNFAVLEFMDGFTVVLKDYFNSPIKGVRIYTDPDGASSGDRLEAILRGINLSRAALIWVAPTVE